MYDHCTLTGYTGTLIQHTLLLESTENFQLFNVTHQMCVYVWALVTRNCTRDSEAMRLLLFTVTEIYTHSLRIMFAFVHWSRYVVRSIGQKISDF